MRSLGIDLAAQAKNTAYCTIEWSSGRALVGTPARGVDDDELLAAMQAADWTGIDAPFGWPEPFTVALAHYLRCAQWPAGVSPASLRLRETDRAVRDTLKTERGIALTPLSVSSNWIAACAWRCAELLRRYRERTGHELDRVAVPLSSVIDRASGRAAGPRTRRRARGHRGLSGWRAGDVGPAASWLQTRAEHECAGGA